MKSQILNSKITKYVITFFLCNVFLVSLAQSAPGITRLIQQNTLKGSRLSLVETTDNYVYHIGTNNSSEIGFDNLSATNTGLDDLFILKSNVSNGANYWFKTFNAGNKGIISPKYAYIDSLENIYVFAQFKGTVTVGTKSITSANQSDAFLMKINNDGNAAWIVYLENGYNSYYKTKCITDHVDTFFVYGQNHLLRISDTDGSVLYNKIYNDVELKSVALKDQNLYLAGYAINPTAFGSEVIFQNNVGFILKGDKAANFTALLNTTPSEMGLISSDISDIAVSNDGLLLSGFYTNKPINLATENGTFSYTYSPNTTYPYNRLYNFVAKVDFSLNTVSFFRSSSPIGVDGIYNVLTYRNSAKLVPYGNGNFRQLLYNTDRSKSISSYTNTNGSTTSFTQNYNLDEYTLITSNDSNGEYQSDKQPLNYGFRMSASANYYTLINNNVRAFTSGLFNISNSNAVWSKQKLTSVGGSYSGAVIKHLNSAKGDLFLTALVEGKADFFGQKINNNIGSYSKYITRLGVDGLPKWIAKFDFTNAIPNSYFNVSQNYVTIDKNDNFYILLNRSEALSSQFTDANGTVINFSQYASNDNRVLIKLDKNGKYIWGKEISGISIAGITVDNNDNIYVTGFAGSLVMNGINYNSTGSSSLFILKFDTNGSLGYSKVYQNDMDAFSVTPVFDGQNNLYIFSEPINNTSSDYVFGTITVPTNDNHSDLLMLKFDANGNAIFGKNFYANSIDYRYAWSNDVAFDGESFVVMGNVLGMSNNNNYMGLDLIDIPKVYSQSVYAPFIAKIKSDGSVIWQKVLESSESNAGNYTNINLDEDKNIYMFYYVKDKVSINGTEYSFDNTKGNKILLKMTTNGLLEYIKTVDLSASSYPIVDVMGDNKINVVAFTSENNVLNYTINNFNGSNLFVATFGSLDQKYLTPEKNYLLLSNTAISNNPNNFNTFELNLVNNVNWIAVSDQNWLNLSFTELNDKNIANTISGSGDAKILLTADTNNSGDDRSANVLFTGDQGVLSKTVVVTQTGVLGANEPKAYITVIYPNPTFDILNIQTNQKISKVEIYDISGKLLISNSSDDKKIKVSDLTNGLYLVKIFTDRNVINSKFIKN